MKTILLDTNMLVSCLRFRIDLFGELERLVAGPHELVVPSPVVQELRVLAAGRGRDRGFARAALALLEKRKVRVEEDGPNAGEEPAAKGKGGQSADDWLVEKAKGTNAIVCTNDVGLKKRLASGKVQIITMLHRSHLDFV